MKAFAGYMIALILVLVLVGMAYGYWYAPVTTVILVRHAERLNDSDTSSLSPDGFRRARALAHVLCDDPPFRAFVSDRRRARQTAQEVERLLNVPVSVVGAAHTEALADSIAAYPGRTLLVVGHADTLPLLLARLGIVRAPAVARNTYDDLFLVQYARRSLFVHLKYGDPS
ncbi:MAG: phosphoglycerate mutase family protein [Bacteroidota bacterium]